ncbi:hypothetical protein UA31_02215 [Photobacterium angustum]|nr:hypothetical protein UB36_02215 [Photobacterium damselae subsp. damselae]KJG47707.1 hypothetical protein UA31_02215 [Photobacterium angustum]
MSFKEQNNIAICKLLFFITLELSEKTTLPPIDHSSLQKFISSDNFDASLKSHSFPKSNSNNFFALLDIVSSTVNLLSLLLILFFFKFFFLD